MAAKPRPRPRTSTRAPVSRDPSPTDVTLEQALEGLFRLGSNRRFDRHQASAVGAVVTRAGYAVLRSLTDEGTLSVRELATACAMDMPTASRQISSLEKEGLVERHSVEGDGRRVEISMTSHGQDVYERTVEYRLEQLTSVLDDWSEEDRASLAEYAARLSRDLARIPNGDRARRSD